MKNTLEIFVRVEEKEEVIHLKKEIDYIPSVGLVIEEGNISKVGFHKGKYTAFVEMLREVSKKELKDLLDDGFIKTKDKEESEEVKSKSKETSQEAPLPPEDRKVNLAGVTEIPKEEVKK